MKKRRLISSILAALLFLLGVVFILTALWTSPNLDMQQKYLGTGMAAMLLSVFVGLFGVD